MYQYQPTRQGDELAWQLAEWIGYGPQTRSICAGLVRNANRLHNLGVMECNGSPWRKAMTADTRSRYDALAVADEERYEAEIERRSAVMVDLAYALPFPDETGAPWPLTLQGDPRGRTAYLTAPDGREITIERGSNLL